MNKKLTVEEHSFFYHELTSIPSLSLEEIYEPLSELFLHGNEFSTSEEIEEAFSKVFLEESQLQEFLGSLREDLIDKEIILDKRKSPLQNVLEMLKHGINSSYALIKHRLTTEFLDRKIKFKSNFFLDDCLENYLLSNPKIYGKLKRFLYAGVYDANAQLKIEKDEVKRIFKLSWSVCNDFPFDDICTYEGGRKTALEGLFETGAIMKFLDIKVNYKQAPKFINENFREFLKFEDYPEDLTDRKKNKLKAVVQAWKLEKIGKSKIKYGKEKIYFEWNYPRYFSFSCNCLIELLKNINRHVSEIDGQGTYDPDIYYLKNLYEIF